LALENVSFKKGITVVYHPLFYFFVFLTGNSLLAYFPLSLQLKIWIGLMFVMIPAFAALGLKSNPVDLKSLWACEEPRTKNYWYLIGGVGCLSLLIRFFHFQTIPVWPMWDDAYCNFCSIQQMQHWNWNLTYTCEKVSPLFFWIEAFFFKLVPPSLRSLWLFPAILSTFTWVIGAWAATRWFSNRTVLIFALVLGLSFWPVYLGKFSTFNAMLGGWEMAEWGLLGQLLNTTKEKDARWAAVYLGICTGIGSYIYITATITIVLVTCFVVTMCLFSKTNKLDLLFLYLFFAIVIVTPVFPTIRANLMTGHAHDYIGFDIQRFLNPEQIRISISYLTVILWGNFKNSYYTFGPLWGGFLNPVLGSFFLLGVLELLRGGNFRLKFGLGIALLLGLSPGLLSSTMEMMRIISLLPLCIALVSIGIYGLLFSAHQKYRLAFLVITILISISLDSYHLLGPFRQWAAPGEYSQDSKSPEHNRAFEILKLMDSTAGPGLVFSDFYFNVFDQSLYVSTYPFNAAINPVLDPLRSKWAAVVIQPNDREIFVKQFKNTTYFDLSAGLDRQDGGMELEILKLTDENRQTFIRWVSLQKKIQSLYPMIPYHDAKASFYNVTKPLWDIYKGLQGDLFLKRCLMEKIVEFESQDKLGEEIKEKLLELPPQELHLSDAFNWKIALIFHRLGLELTRRGDYPKARQSFLRAASYDRAYPLQLALSKLSEAQKKQTH